MEWLPGMVERLDWLIDVLTVLVDCIQGLGACTEWSGFSSVIGAGWWSCWSLSLGLFGHVSYWLMDLNSVNWVIWVVSLDWLAGHMYTFNYTELAVMTFYSLGWLFDRMWTDWLIWVDSVDILCYCSVVWWIWSIDWRGFIYWMVGIGLWTWLELTDWFLTLFDGWIGWSTAWCRIDWFDWLLMLYSNDLSWLCRLDGHWLAMCLDLIQWYFVSCLVDQIIWLVDLYWCMSGLRSWCVARLAMLDDSMYWLIDLATACNDWFDDQIWFRACKWVLVCFDGFVDCLNCFGLLNACQRLLIDWLNAFELTDLFDWLLGMTDCLYS